MKLNKEIKLPIQPGDQIGTLIYYYNGEVYREIPLTVKESVEKNSFNWPIRLYCVTNDFWGKCITSFMHFPLFFLFLRQIA